MKHVGVICEFNPFHHGHAHLLRSAKEAFPEKGVVCLMSGNFVQRGEFAILEKYSRAQSALLGGADLVLELPFPFSCLSGESFGKSAVSILSRLGVCDTLAFGSEIPDKERLLNTARRLADPAFSDGMKAYLSEHKGTGYPAARQAVYEEKFGKEEILSLSNASLAMEYLVSNLSLAEPMEVFPVMRKGDSIREKDVSDDFSSATALRRAILEGRRDLPFTEGTLDAIRREEREGRFPVSAEGLYPVLTYLLKTKSEKELGEIYGLAALLHRAKRFVGEADSLEELVSKMKNASFTDSRIRRALLALLCQIPRHAEKETPAYTLLLGANEKGREILGEMKENALLPVFTKPAHLFRSSDKAVQRQASRAALAEEIYGMAFPERQSEGYFLKKHPVLL